MNLIIDNLIIIAIGEETNLYFHLINEIYIIIFPLYQHQTKGLLRGENAITADTLDKVIHRVKVIILGVDNYRLKYRDLIFSGKTVHVCSSSNLYP